MKIDKKTIDDLSVKLEKILIMTVGLPRSGKSTWARKQGIPIVNPDSIRLALYGEFFIEEAESMIWCIAEYMVKALFLAGHDKVILDATNLTRKSRDLWKDNMWKRSYVYFDTNEVECLHRAANDGRCDLSTIIIDMNKEKELDFEDD